MAVIALLAVELAALRVASDGYVNLTRHLNVVMLAVAAYLARYRQGDRAAWWFGFALCGWAYLALVIDASARRDLLSVRPIAPPPMNLLGLFINVNAQAGQSATLIRLWWNQYDIIQSILTLVVACLGGFVCWIWNRRRGAPYREEERRAGKLKLDDQVE